MKKKLTRAEKNELTRKNLMEAAVKVVGQIGYKDASVTDITSHAKIAQGTFYNYFESKQDILDKLLPELGEDLLEFLGRQVGDATFLDREEKSIRAYFQFLKEKPEFYRILVEAQVYSPQSFNTHADNLLHNYEAALQKTKERGFLKNYSESEFEAIALILLGARVYLSRQYSFRNGKALTVPEHVIKTYMKLIAGGLTAGDERSTRTGRSSPKQTEAPELFTCELIRSDEFDLAAAYMPAPQVAIDTAIDCDFYLQLVLADFTRQAIERLVGHHTRIRTTSFQSLSAASNEAMRLTCRAEALSDTEGILHVRIIADDSAHRTIASCQVLYLREPEST